MAINLDHVTEQITVTDTAANASLTVNPKGTGAFNIAAGSGGLNLSNGGTVTALTFSGVGYGYTTQTSAAIAAPTTAGGVQATATVTMGINTASVASGGTGYAVGNVLSVVGGTSVSGAGTLTVSAVSGGVITAVTSTNFAPYSVLPSSPVSVTGGSGSGATFNPLWFTASFIITNAGSGYVEQPTVTLSGGGGSGAAAYASVGSGTTVRSLGNTMSFNTPSGQQVLVNNSGGTTASFIVLQGDPATNPKIYVDGVAANIALPVSSKGTSPVSFFTNAYGQQQLNVAHTASAVNYVQATGAATGNAPYFSSQGSDTNINFAYTAKGTGNHDFYTSGTSFTQQFRISHTASAVNYLQVQGNSTTNSPIVSVQGSDANIGLVVSSKGTARIGFFTNNISSQQFVINHTASAVNYLQVVGGATGAAPVLSALGSDTNIDLTLAPKGTGNVRFGTHTGTADTAVSGYIEIKDSGGTIRKLAVIT
jgi:hypothetical protein